MKRIITIITALLLSITVFFPVYAEEETYSGTCGENAAWKLENGVMTISGSGPMYNYGQAAAPYMGYRSIIKEVVIEKGITTVGDNAFFNCQWIEKVSIPDGIEKIGDYAFWCARPLEEVHLPEGVKTIGEEAFGGCNSLQTVNIPSTVTAIGDYAFSVCDLQSLELPDGLKSIGRSAFSENRSLQSIAIPDTVTEMGSEVFRSCSGLKSVKLSNAMTSIPADTFMMCRSLTDITIPASVTEIGSGAFSQCDSLETIVIPDSVKKIGDYAFENCEALRNLTIPSTLNNFGIGAFRKCTGLVVNGFVIVNHYLFQYCGEDQIINVPDDVVNISASAFYGIQADRVNIPAGVKRIEQYAFCESVIPKVHFSNGIEYIGSNAFSSSGIESLTLPDSIHMLDNSAFQNSALKEVNLPDHEIEYGRFVFKGCQNLFNGDFIVVNGVLWDCKAQETSISIPEGVRVIPEMAFIFNTRYKEVTFPSTLEYIGRDAFASTYLSKVTIPGNVKTIGECAFQDCALTELILGEGVETIELKAFDGCKNLTSATLPESLRTIGDYAFYRCNNLKEITVPAGVESIGEQALGFTEFGGQSGVKYGLVISGYKDSEAQKYALRNGISFKDLSAGETPPSQDDLVIEFLDSSLYFWPYMTMTEGDTEQLPYVRTLDSDGKTVLAYSMDNITVEVSDPEVLAVVRNTIIAVKAGSADITYTAHYEGRTGMTVLHVTVNPFVLEHVERKEATCTEDGNIEYWYNASKDRYYKDAEGTEQISRADTILPAFGHDWQLSEWKWSSDYRSASALFLCSHDSSHTNEQTARVSVTRLPDEAIYTATVTLNSNTYTDTRTVKNNPEPVKPVSISLNRTQLTMATESETKLVSSIQPSDASQNVTWKSSDPSIATVDQNGNVRALRYGTATITAISTETPSLSASCTVKTRYYDVNDTSLYYFNPVYWAADRNITKGYDNVYFGPKNNCTREAVVTFLWRTAGKPEPKTTVSKFSDVQDKSKYYYKAVLWASENGITAGYNDGTFKPDATCLREHVVTFLWRYAHKPEPKTAKNPFNDVRQSDYYYKAALWANEKGIAKGYSTGEYAGGFGPKLDCLREHVVTFLYRYAK